MYRQQKRIFDKNVEKLVADLNLGKGKLNVVETDKVTISSFCHMAIQKLVENDLVRGVVTENVDHMHIKAGIDEQFVVERNSNIYEF